MQKRVVVTGGFGFIGAALVQHLLAVDDGAHIHVVDDLSTSPLDLDDFLDALGRPDRLTYDLSTVQAFFARPQHSAWQEIYHLASPVGPAGVLPHAGNLVRQVVGDVYAIVDYCLAARARLLDVSTSEIYGGGEAGYCSEQTTMVVPQRPTVRLEYAVAKLAAETAIFNHVTANNLLASIVRPFNVAGPRQSPRGGFVLPRFIQQAATGRPLTVFGDGRARRAFTHVDDMAAGLRQAMARGRSGQAYNLGNPANRCTVLELAEMVLAVTGSRSSIEFVDPKSIYGPLYEEASDKFPDAEKAITELGWTPKHDIRQVIEDCWTEYRRQAVLDKVKDRI